ncbi:hypothetical protein A1Q2_03916 [Trichosporon asahii var. asahii CBS 8904]|uniref:AP-2 complex subunit alpha n=1 Tax=Trichosporon asahii var. asahii (strain CBS 8904) TaxID=1220162 RepID=K1VYL7_TRIAC|nr:hypothetical protein A1Q2_03916 [Trichosporon asahii var. asahii CBS 8904]
MATSMRGLTQYISDLRACRVRELEEKRVNREMAHIRQKFKDGNLDGYQKKKYLSKVVFTYILGYKVDIGHMEAVNLIHSNKYSEKQIGYLAITLLMHENSDIVRLVINSIRKDLEDSNEINNCLALHAIANLGGREMAEALADSTFRAMISPVSTTFVKKKAALTLLRLYRKHPSVMPVQEWAERIVPMIGERDQGVAMTATSLVTAMAQDHLEAFAGCYQHAVDRLDKYYPPPDNPEVVEMVNGLLQAIIDMSQETPRNVQHNNAQNAVLFEAINLAIHLNPESKVVSNASVLLGRFILARETNVRYLGLDAMAHLAACSTSLEPVKRHQDTIILSLKDRDISVRRRALDLLYSMCDTTNAKVIVGELLKYLQVADYNLREEMVLKIAILTERFATEYEWYIDTILQLISTAGDHVGAEVWYRVVQLVTNNEDLQPYASTAVYRHIKKAQCHENMVKVAGYILGEFGHLIANDEGCSPIELFHALHSKINICTAPTRALLLTTYIKWVNLFPEIKEHLVNIFRRYTHVLDAELQQRACEYLALATRNDNDELLQAVCDEMPVFPERESALVNRLHKRGNAAQDKRTWVIGQQSENRDKFAKQFSKDSTSAADDETVPVPPPKPQMSLSQPQPQASLSVDPQPSGNLTPQTPSASEPMMGPGPSSQSTMLSEDIMTSLAGLDMSSPAPEPASAQQRLLPEQQQFVSEPTGGAAPLSTLTSPTTPDDLQHTATLGGVNPALLHGLTTGPNVEKWLERLSYASEGVLYEDKQVQIGIKAEYHGPLGRIALFIGNKISTPFTSVSARIENSEPGLSANFHDTPVTRIEGLAQIQEMIHVEAKGVFTSPPVLRFTYLAGGFTTLVLKLPVFLSKFIEGVQLDQAAFFERWKIIGGPPREAQQIFPIKLSEAGEIDTQRNEKVIAGQSMSVLRGIDPNPVNIVTAGVLHMTSGKVGILGRLEPNRDAKLCRLTVRSTNEEVSKECLKLFSKPINADVAASL